MGRTSLPRMKRGARLVLRKGKLYALAAAVVALDVGPDLLNAVAGVDWTALLPSGWGVTFGGWLVVARLVLPILAARRQMRQTEKM